VVVERNDVTSWTSLRNLENVHVLVPDQLNTYDVLCADDIVFTQSALATFLAGPTKGKPAKADVTGVVVQDAAVEDVVVQDAPKADKPAEDEKPAKAPDLVDVQDEAAGVVAPGSSTEAEDDEEETK